MHADDWVRSPSSARVPPGRVRLVLLDATACDDELLLPVLGQAGIAAPVALLFCSVTSGHHIDRLVRQGVALSIDRQSPFHGEMLRGVMTHCARQATEIWGPIELPAGSEEVLVDGQPRRLRGIGRRILSLLLQAGGRLVSLGALHRHAHRAVVTRSTVSTHVGALRRKLGPYGSLIETVGSEGYRLRPAPEARASWGPSMDPVRRRSGIYEASHAEQGA